MARLPIPGGDNGTWGDILNDFLRQEHNADGTQKTLDITKGGTGATTASSARTNLGAISSSQAQAKVDSHEAAADPHTGYIQESLFDAKGDMIVAAGANTAARLPAGSNGQVLTADSAESGGAKWALPALAMGWWSGTKPGSYNFYGQSGGATTWVNEELRCVPVFFHKSVTIDRIGVSVTTAGDAGCVDRLGLYDDTGDLYPGELLLDAGTVATDTTGEKEITISQEVEGLVWVAHVVQSPGAVGSRRHAGNDNAPFSVGVSAADAAFTRRGFEQTGVTGALPATFTSTVGAAGGMVVVFWRITP